VGSNIGEKAAIDHILESEEKGEINEDNVLYIVENINVAGKVYQLGVSHF
jgi:trans-cinnamate 4-monooxygenase